METQSGRGALLGRTRELRLPLLSSPRLGHPHPCRDRHGRLRRCFRTHIQQPLDLWGRPTGGTGGARKGPLAWLPLPGLRRPAAAPTGCTRPSSRRSAPQTVCPRHIGDRHAGRQQPRAGLCPAVSPASCGERGHPCLPEQSSGCWALSHSLLLRSRGQGPSVPRGSRAHPMHRGAVSHSPGPGPSPRPCLC